MKNRYAGRLGWQLAVTVLLACAAVGWTSPSAAGEAALPEGWEPIGPARLAAMRGGYALPSGLVVAFGFERVARVNGELVSTTRVDIPDVARMTGPQALELARLREGQLVQVGAGDVHAVAGGSAGLVLQNTLDGARIDVQTTIDAATSALGLVQAMNFGEALGRAGVGPAGSP